MSEQTDVQDRRAEAEEFMESIPKRNRKLGLSEARTLSTTLTQERIDELTEELTATRIDWEEETEKKKAVMANFAATLKHLDLRISKLVHTIDDKVEDAPVKCEWWYDFTNGVKELIRTDTNELVSTVPLADWEWQEAIEFEGSEGMEEAAR